MKRALAVLAVIAASAFAAAPAEAHWRYSVYSIDKSLEDSNIAHECGAGLLKVCDESTVAAWWVDWDKNGTVRSGSHSWQFRARYAETIFPGDCQTTYMRFNVSSHWLDPDIWHDRGYRKVTVSGGLACPGGTTTAATTSATTSGGNDAACYNQPGTYYAETCPDLASSGETETYTPPSGWVYNATEANSDPPARDLTYDVADNDEFSTTWAWPCYGYSSSLNLTNEEAQYAVWKYSLSKSTNGAIAKASSLGYSLSNSYYFWRANGPTTRASSNSVSGVTVDHYWIKDAGSPSIRIRYVSGSVTKSYSSSTGTCPRTVWSFTTDAAVSAGPTSPVDISGM